MCKSTTSIDLDVVFNIVDFRTECIDKCVAVFQHEGGHFLLRLDFAHFLKKMKKNEN